MIHIREVGNTGDPNHPLAKTMEGTIPVYMIYYGSGHTDTHKNILDTLVAHISSHSLWNIIKKFNGGIPYLAKRLNIPCSTTCTDPRVTGCYPCSIKQYDESPILKNIFNAQLMDKSQSNLYVLVLGTNVNYVFSQTTAAGLVLGHSQLCGKLIIRE